MSGIVLSGFSRGATTWPGDYNITGTTASTSSATGALTVSGGIGVGKDSYFNGIKIGRGGGNSQGNTVVGVNALQLNADMYGYSSAFGHSALYSNMIGFYNDAFGAWSLYSNTSGLMNSAFGTKAFYSNTEGNSGAAFGYEAMYSNLTGSSNVAFGSSALSSNTTGSGNVALGVGAGQYQGVSGSTPLVDPENSIYIGANSRGFSNADQNSIVIGTSAIGKGANTTVIGTSATTKTHLYGTVEAKSFVATDPTGAFSVEGYTDLYGHVGLAGGVAIGAHSVATSGGWAEGESSVALG